MLSARTSYVLLAVLVVVFILIGGLYAVKTPPWQTPDEPAHYNYIAQIADNGCCPVIAPGDWNSAYLEGLKAERFPDDADLSSIEYEDHQPPLYYLAASLIYRASGGSPVALRLLSVIFGAGTVTAAYFVIARLFPRQRILALAVAAFVAFVPQHIAIMAGINNDSLAEMVLGIILVVAVTYLGNPVSAGPEGTGEPCSESVRPHAAALGGLVGGAFLTKLTIYLPAVLAVTVALLCRWRAERRPIRWLAGQIVWVGCMALIPGAVWWGRNIAVYGWPDFLGQLEHNTVVVGQLRTADLIAETGLGSYLSQFLTWTYHSFWGQFGWMGVPMPPRVYLLIGLFLLGALAGLIILIAMLRERLGRLDGARRGGLWVLAAVLLATVVGYIYYNLTFVQFQGRYLFPALIPVGLLIVAGLQGWSMLLGRWLPGEKWKRVLAWFPLVALGWLPLLAVYALFRYIVPNLG